MKFPEVTLGVKNEKDLPRIRPQKIRSVEVDLTDTDGTNGQQVFAEKAISDVFSRCGLEVPSNIHLLAAKCLSAAIEVAGPNPSDLDIQMEFRRLVETIESQH